MKREVVWSRKAGRDLDAIVAFLTERNPRAAERAAERIVHSTELLGDFATGHRGRVEGTFEKPIPSLPYIVLYEIVAEPDGRERIGILRVVHSARDWREGEAPPE